MKKFTLLLTTMFITLCFTGCAPVVNQLVLLEERFLEEEISAVEETPHIGFCPGEFDENTQVIMTASAFTDYESDYNVYSSSIHYDTLPDNKKQVYHAFEYAMENGYSTVLLDDSLVEKSEDLVSILEMFSLDSPLLEQNLFYEHGTFTTYHNLEADSFFQHHAKFDGYYITVENFNTKWWPQRLEAIDKAKEIVASLSPDMNDAEKAEKLFLHLTYNTRYVLSKTLNETNDELGHTWNCFEIEGKWYNADATVNSLVPTDTIYMHAGINFAFPDIMQEKKNIYYMTFDCTESRTALMIYKEGLINYTNVTE